MSRFLVIDSDGARVEFVAGVEFYSVSAPPLPFAFADLITFTRLRYVEPEAK